MTIKLGKFKKVSLIEAWKSESEHFTPWLASEENIILLGETLGLELEIEGTEQNVGPFRADILCKDLTNGSWVLIENQLERTDHSHLGQLLTYAAGLNAVTIVWIAERFAEEHRAALDWLNEITDERFNFFGLEIELWQIEDSPYAPKFNIASKPNNWSKTVSNVARQMELGNLTETQRLQLDYWTVFSKLLSTSSEDIVLQRPMPYSYANFAIGRSDFLLNALTNSRVHYISVRLMITGQHSQVFYNLLEEKKDEIEKQFGTRLDWRENPGKKEKHIVVQKEGVDPLDKGDWPNQHKWIMSNLELFKQNFGPRIKKLDYSQEVIK